MAYTTKAAKIHVPPVTDRAKLRALLAGLSARRAAPAKTVDSIEADAVEIERFRALGYLN